MDRFNDQMTAALASRDAHQQSQAKLEITTAGRFYEAEDRHSGCVIRPVVVQDR